MITSLISLFPFLLAFLVFPFGTSWFEIPKVISMWLIVFCASMIFIWQAKSWKSLSQSIPFSVLIGGIFLLSVVHLLFSHTPVMFFGNTYRLQGVFSLWMLLLFAFIVSQGKKFSHTALAAFIGLLLMTFAAFVAPRDVALRAVGTLGEANSLGAYALFLLPLALTLPKEKYRKKSAIGISVLLAIICIFVSGSRSSLVGLIAECLFFFFSQKVRMSVAAGITAVFLLCSLFLPFLDVKQPFDSRSTIWATAVEAGREKPLFGWGVGNTEVGLRKAAETLQTTLRYQYVDSSHNVFLDWWVQGGIVGISLFVGILFLTSLSLIRKKQIALHASLFGILAVMLFNPVSTAILVPLWWIIGQSMMRTRYTSNKKPPKR